jgi:hypothetical protein
VVWGQVIGAVPAGRRGRRVRVHTTSGAAVTRVELTPNRVPSSDDDDAECAPQQVPSRASISPARLHDPPLYPSAHLPLRYTHLRPAKAWPAASYRSPGALGGTRGRPAQEHRR